VTLGIFFLNQRGVEGAILQMINHGITTGALFLCVGMIYERTHSREIKDNAGIAKHLPLFAAFLTVFSLSSLAFPATNSFVGEFLVLAGAFAENKIIAGAAIPGAVLAAAYMYRLLQHVLYKGEGRPDIVDLNAREVVTLAPLLFFVLWIGLAPGPFLDVMHTSVNYLLSQVDVAQAAALQAAAL
ncbi:MAG: proton-conducting transporter membrane subunit, partial [Thermodesulfobacteriota bacterium]